MIGVKRNRSKDSPYVPIRPMTRVELHVHLDGALRHDTIWELARERNVALPGRGTFKEMIDYLVVKTPKDLFSFLSRFDIVHASIRGNLKSIERVAYEFVEDQALLGIAYTEARFCPHLWIPDAVRENTTGDEAECKKWVWDVAEAFIKGVKRGQTDFESRVNLIATCVRGYSKQWYQQVLELAADVNFHDNRIIGIDATGAMEVENVVQEDAAEMFDKATKLGIHRTVHAAECGPASQVPRALEILHAERIGHGYRIVNDQTVYDRIKTEKIHLECCPWSSLLTGSIPSTQIPHPIVKFFEDGFNVSVNTDDPTLTGTSIDDEYRLLSNWGLSEVHYVRGTFNAARSCFLPENEKSDLIQNICKVFGHTP